MWISKGAALIRGNTVIIQNYGVNEFHVLSLKTQLLLPQIAEFYGLDSKNDCCISGARYY